MLVMREEQMRVFRDYKLKHFEDRALKLLQECSPEQYEDVGEKELRNFIKKTINSAAGYGIKSEYDVARYICLCFILGQDFGTDDRYPWATEILNDDALHSTIKLDKLDQLAETHDLNELS